MKLEFVPSAANFVLVRVGDGPAVFKQLLERQIIVRALKGYNLPEWVRISVGTMEQNRKCIAALKEVLKSRDELTASDPAITASGETIAAISSPAGEGAIALIRDFRAGSDRDCRSCLSRKGEAVRVRIPRPTPGRDRRWRTDDRSGRRLGASRAS